MARELRACKKLRTARKYAEPDQPILRIGDLYIVGQFISCDSVDFIEPNGAITGTICLLHLSKGNHNHSDISKGKSNFYGR